MKAQFVTLLLLAGTPAFAGTIYLQPSTSTVTLADSLTISVNVVGVADLYAFQFDAGFDPTILSAMSVTEGNLFAGLSVFFSPGSVDNAAGTITFVADSLSGPGPGVTADGSLAKILFHTTGAGTAVLNLSNIILLNSNLGDIAVETAGATVAVTNVPEPSYPLLVAVALALCLGYRPAGWALARGGPRVFTPGEWVVRFWGPLPRASKGLLCAALCFISVPASGLAADPCVTEVEIWAYIDGRDRLHMTPYSIWWEHFDYAAVGRFFGANEPTYLFVREATRNGETSQRIDWIPSWNAPPGNYELRDVYAVSAPYALPFPTPVKNPDLLVTGLEARERLTTIQSPTAGNGYELVLEFNDYRSGGPAWYGVRLDDPCLPCAATRVQSAYAISRPIETYPYIGRHTYFLIQSADSSWWTTISTSSDATHGIKDSGADYGNGPIGERCPAKFSCQKLTPPPGQTVADLACKLRQGRRDGLGYNPLCRNCNTWVKQAASSAGLSLSLPADAFSSLEEFNAVRPTLKQQYFSNCIAEGGPVDGCGGAATLVNDLGPFYHALGCK